MITVIYDGECDFCKSCVAWLQNRIQINALPNQSIITEDFGITREQCEKSVVVIDEDTYFGAKAIAYLLFKSDHKLASRILKLFAPLSDLGYRYVARHRDGKLVNFLHWIIRKFT